MCFRFDQLIMVVPPFYIYIYKYFFFLFCLYIHDHVMMGGLD